MREKWERILKTWYETAKEIKSYDESHGNGHDRNASRWYWRLAHELFRTSVKDSYGRGEITAEDYLYLRELSDSHYEELMEVRH